MTWTEISKLWEKPEGQSVNQSGAVQCDHYLPRISIPRRSFVHLSLVLLLLTLLVHPTSFLVVFPSCVFLQSFQLSQDVLVSLFSSGGQKKVAWRILILFINDLVVSATRNTVSFDFSAFHEIRSILRRNHISAASRFFVTVLKLSTPHIHTSEWYSTPGLFFSCEWRCIYLMVPISFSGSPFLLALFFNQFQCCCVHRLMLKDPRI